MRTSAAAASRKTSRKGTPQAAWLGHWRRHIATGLPLPESSYGEVALQLRKIALDNGISQDVLRDLIDWWWGYKFPQLEGCEDMLTLRRPWPLARDYQEFRTWSQQHASLIEENGMANAIKASLEAYRMAQMWRPSRSLRG